MEQVYSKQERIIVTGAAGMVGAAVVAHLLSKGYSNIHLIVRNKTNIFLLKRVLKYSGFAEKFKLLTIYECDLTDYHALYAILQPSDIIFNCAAMVDMNDVSSKISRNNTLISHCLAQAAVEKEAKLIVHVSSVSTLGKEDDEYPQITENSLPSTILSKGIYAQSKFFSEGEFQRAVSGSNTNLIIVNPSVIIGFGEFSGNGSASIFRKLSKGCKYYPPGGVGYVSAKDVARAMEMLSQEPKAFGERFILNAENLTHKEFITKITLGFKAKQPTKPVPKGILLWSYRITKALNYIGINTLISSYTISSLRDISVYNGEKIRSFIDFEYSGIDSAIDECINAFRNTKI